MRLLYVRNYLNFLKPSRISRRQFEQSVNLMMTQSYLKKCKHGLSRKNGFRFLFENHLKLNNTGLGTSNSLLRYCTGKKEDYNDERTAAVKEEGIDKDNGDSYEPFVGVDNKERITGDVDDNIKEIDTTLRSSSGLFKIDGHVETIIEDVESLSAEEEVEFEDEDEDIEDFIDYGFTVDDDDDVELHVYTPPIELKRGSTGVFDIEDLVTVLEDENGIDIRVIDVPKTKNYVDYMVIVSGKSARHIRSMAENIRWLYKQKKHKSDPFIRIEGLNTNNWMAMDLGNIALHIFLPAIREKYDLETLWTIGDLEDNSNLELDDPYAMRELPSQEINENSVQFEERNSDSLELKTENSISVNQNLSNQN